MYFGNFFDLDYSIAVRTKNTQNVSDYSCNGRHVFTQTRELERPLVGSILQSMWGVPPSHRLWSPRHNTTLVDYTWCVGQTPFGPFSELHMMGKESSYMLSSYKGPQITTYMPSTLLSIMPPKKWRCPLYVSRIHQFRGLGSG
ncbi:unnamed protein product [Prunus armeniaca]|uniref:Uncharacterized protein n=1 Tax=Prunus armeniaca TaxID=36596 RepID=A0A6J5XTT4_PRUAR|nr:unnamed protein product [Prunus armeniaca]